MTTATTPRMEPLEWREGAIMRGLIVSADACRWIEGLGIDFEALFTDPRARCLAVWAVARDCRSLSAPVAASLSGAHPEHASIAEWYFPAQDEPESPEERKADVQRGYDDVLRLTRELAGRWFSPMLAELARWVNEPDPRSSPDEKASEAAKYIAAVCEFLQEGTQ